MCTVRSLVCILALFVLLSPLYGAAAGSAFTYQGKLTSGTGHPVLDGTYAMRFKLFDDADPAPPENQIGSYVDKTVTVTGGVFTVELDFGASAFSSGQARWLETAVGGTVLAPRVRMNPAPYAVYSSAPWAPADGGIAYTGGSVGIGTDSPAGILQVMGSGGVRADQSQPNHNATISMIGAGGYWQSFTAGASLYLSGVRTVFGTGGYWIGTLCIYAGEGTAGTRLASQEIWGTGFGDRLYVLKTPVPVTAGSKYTFEFGSPMGPSMWVYTSDVYPGGRFSSNGVDVQFTTYVCDSPSTPIMIVDQAIQSVGIGTGTPAAKLDVDGIVKMTGFRMPTSPADGYVLTSDSGGTGTWQPSASGGPGPAGGDLTGTYPDPTIANLAVTEGKIATNAVTETKIAAGAITETKIASSAVTNAKIASVDWSKVTSKPASMPPSGPAGGELAGTYPNPSIAANAVDSSNLASDAASLAKVSGGAMSASGSNISTTGRVNNAAFRSGAASNAGPSLAVDFAPNNMDQGEVHFGNTGDNQWVDAWLIYSNSSVMGNYIKFDGATTTTGHFRLNGSGVIIYSKTNAADSSGYLYYDAANKDVLVYEAATANGFCEWWSYDRRN